MRSKFGPPRFVMSRQYLHVPHSSARQPSQTPHRFLRRRLRRDDALLDERSVRVLGRGRCAGFLALGFVGAFVGAFFGLNKFFNASSAASDRRASAVSKSAADAAFAATSRAFDASTSFCATATASSRRP